MKLWLLGLSILVLLVAAIQESDATNYELSINEPINYSRELASEDQEKIKVMVIDSGITPLPQFKNFLSKANSKKDLTDTHGHGTHVTGLILYGRGLGDRVCKEVVIYSCKAFYPELHTPTNCFKAAKNFGIDIVNFSGGGTLVVKEEEKAVSEFKGIIVAATGNEHSDISKAPFFPASYKEVVAVGNGRDSKNRSLSSNYGLEKIVWIDGEDILSFSNKKDEYVLMTGSSQSAALYTHELLKAKCQRLKSAK